MWAIQPGQAHARRDSGTLFTPSAISGLALWLKSDVGTFTTSVGSTPAVANDDPVGRWEDQSGNARHLLQATTTKRFALKTGIQGGLPAVRSDGTDDFLNATWGAISQPYTIVALIVPRGSMTAADVLIDGFDTTHRHALYINTGDYPAVYAGGTPLNTNMGYGLNSPDLLIARFNGASSTYRFLDSPDLAGSVGAHTSNGLTLAAEFGGNNRHVQIDYLEVLMYTSALTDAQIAQIGAYLQSRWALRRFPTRSTIVQTVAATWESIDVANPDVFRDTPNSRWVMNYSGWNGTSWKTGLAYSTDLLTWTKEATNPVFSPNGSEGTIAANGSIVLLGSTYYLYYQAELAGGTQICCATSSDLLTWARQNGGAAVIAIDGTDTVFTADPSARLMPDGITIELFYVSRNGGGTRFVRRATSTDGVAFSKIATGTFMLTGIDYQANFGEPWPLGDTGASFDMLTDWCKSQASFQDYRRIARFSTADSGATWTFRGVFLAPIDSDVQVFDSCPIVHNGTMYFFHAHAPLSGAGAGMTAQIGVTTSIWP